MMPTSPPPRRRRRAGCLGCLTQCVLVLALGGLAMLGAEWIFAPWGFHLGGTFRPVPLWQGVAHVRAGAGEYVLWLWMSPSGGGRFPSFSGGVYVCTPRGEGITLRLYGIIPERVTGDTNGKPMRIDLHHRGWFGPTTDGRPRLTFRGRWQNSDLVMQDEGSLSAAFLPDGRVYDGPPAHQPQPTQTLSVVFHEVPWTTWSVGCQAGR